MGQLDVNMIVMGVCAGVASTLRCPRALPRRSIPNNVLNPDICGIGGQPIGQDIAAPIVGRTTDGFDVDIERTAFRMHRVVPTIGDLAAVIDFDGLCSIRVDDLTKFTLNECTEYLGAFGCSSRTRAC